MSKFIMSLGDVAYEILQLEAARRYSTVQELLTAVIIPEWVEQNPPAQKILSPRLAPPLIRSRYASLATKSILDGETRHLRYDDRAGMLEPVHDKCSKGI